MPTDILAIAAHRDDVELTCAGLLLKAVDQGYRTAILDLTAGEAGTRGSAQLRQGDAFLQHGSLLLEDDQSLVRDLAGLPAGPAAEMPLAAALGRPVGFAEAAAAVLEHAEALLGARREGPGAPPAAAALVETHAARFRDPAWTWQR